MSQLKEWAFCSKCMKKVSYELIKKPREQEFRGKVYQFEFSIGSCSECGELVSPLGIIDLNNEELVEQYIEAENIISVDDISNIMSIYNIGKRPLSVALGFGELTITNYFNGRIPLPEYSNIMWEALTSPKFMRDCVEKNKDKIAKVAYNNVITEIDKLEDDFKNISDKLLMIISYIFNQMDEITPLTMQKILYYTQGVNFALNAEPMFKDDCRAWVHGPVYGSVYHLFKDFKYDPIDDCRFAMLKNRYKGLSDAEKSVLDLVISTFGMYNGKTLERVTHNETPWIEARNRFDPDATSEIVISKAKIQDYFTRLNEKYDFSSETGIRNYIDFALSKNK